MARPKKEWQPLEGDRVKFTSNRKITRIGVFIGFHVPVLSNPSEEWTFYEVDIDGKVIKGYSLNQLQPHGRKKKE